MSVVCVANSDIVECIVGGMVLLNISGTMVLFDKTNVVSILLDVVTVVDAVDVVAAVMVEGGKVDADKSTGFILEVM